MTAPPRGFTLMEVMIVLLLVGIITSFAMLSVGGGPRQRLAEEGQRLAALVELHQQEAILSGEIRGIQFGRTGYAILILDDKGQWVAPTAAATLTRHALPEDITLSLWIEGQSVDLKTVSSLPQVVLLSSGETTEFVAVLSLVDAPALDAPLYRVASDTLGRLKTSEVER